MVCECLVELEHVFIDKTFTYKINKEQLPLLKVGMRVVVPFGKQTLEGFVLKIYENKDVSLENKLKDKEEVENGKVIYLTFDDGPSKYTDDILNILDKYNVKATFFLVCSNNLEEYTKKYIQKGHTIGLHSCSHNYKQIYSSKDAYFEDLNKLKNRISISSGYDSIFLRFPGGSSNTVSKFNKGIMSSLTREVEQNGYRYYDWNIDSNDAGGANENLSICIRQRYGGVPAGGEEHHRRAARQCGGADFRHTQGAVGLPGCAHRQRTPVPAGHPGQHRCAGGQRYVALLDAAGSGRSAAGGADFRHYPPAPRRRHHHPAGGAERAGGAGGGRPGLCAGDGTYCHRGRRCGAAGERRHPQGLSGRINRQKRST